MLYFTEHLLCTKHYKSIILQGVYENTIYYFHFRNKNLQVEMERQNENHGGPTTKSSTNCLTTTINYF